MIEEPQITHTTLADMCVEDVSFQMVAPVDQEVVQDKPFEYPPCTRDEDSFALAVIETSGNIAAAYKMIFGTGARMPLAKGKELLAKPQVALRIKTITDAVQEGSLISVGAHLDQLATIRDMSIVTGQLKTAYMAERSRGEAVGIYQKHEKGNGKGNTQVVQFNISMASKHDETI